jgi:hypothetical protein
VCLAYRDGDALVFEAPELERVVAYLSLRGLAERVEEEGGRIRAVPYVDGVEESLRSLCATMPSDLKLDLLYALASDGWIVDRDLSRMRKSAPSAPHNRRGVRLRQQAPPALLDGRLQRPPEATRLLRAESGAGVEAEREFKTLVEALDVSDAVLQRAGAC